MIIITGYVGVSAQTIYTYDIVYDLLQQNCNSSGCHNNIDKAAGLDLEGSGIDELQKMIDVHNNLYFKEAANSISSAKGEYLVYPGDPYRSLLFRKINKGLALDVSLEPGEGDEMPPSYAMDDKEIELIRQWILFGAQIDESSVDLVAIIDYYDNNGIDPLGYIPSAPPPGKGFQIHVGPFFLRASQSVTKEKEFYSKYTDFLQEPTEIVKIETHMSNFSHHAIINKFVGDESENVEYGLREQFKYENSEFVSGTQYTNTWELPEGTAFQWNQETDLDLNIHFVNYSQDKVAKCEVYMNIYTQEDGTAEKIMKSLLFSNHDIYIPNDGQEYTFEKPIFSQEQYPVDIWAIQGHTHDLGTDFHVYLMDEEDQAGEKIYDGGCGFGLPGCQLEYYDHEHIPTAVYEPYERIEVGGGLVYEASYVNNTQSPVKFGLRSTDEMMLFIMYYTIDSTGPPVFPVDTNILPEITEPFPNPASGIINIRINEIENGRLTFIINDVYGKQIYEHTLQASSDPYIAKIETDGIPLSTGMYYLTVIDGSKILSTQKILIAK